MKRAIIVSVFVMLGFAAFSQVTCQPDERLYTRYSEDRIEKMQQNEPRHVCLKNYELDNGYQITTADAHKLSAMDKLMHYNYKEKKYEGEVADVNPQDFNLYDYMYERSYEATNYYRIGNTNKVLIIYPQKRFTKEFNAYYERLNQ